MAQWRTDFSKLWAGESASLVGSQVSTIALPLLAVSSIGATPWEVGVLAAVGTAPFLLLGIPAGMIADRVRRRPLLVMANLMQLVGMASIPAVAWLGLLSIPAMLPGVAFAGCGRVVFQICYRAYIPMLVPEEHLTGANARLSASESVAEIAGPGLGGYLVSVAGSAALLIGASSHVASLLGLSLIRGREQRPREGEGGSALVRTFQGFALVLSNANLRAFAGEAAGYNLFWAAVEPLLIVLAVRELGISEVGLGLGLAVGAIGALVGALTTQQAARRFGLGTTLVVSVVIGDVAPLALPFLPHSDFALPLLAGFMFVRGVGITGCNVHTMTIRQTITPRHMQGRVNAAYVLLANGMTPVGSILGGVLAAAMGVQPALIVVTIALLATSGFIVFSPSRRLRRVEDIPKAPIPHARRAVS